MLYDLGAGEKGGRKKWGDREGEGEDEKDMQNEHQEETEREQTFYETMGEQLNFLDSIIPEADLPSPQDDEAEERIRQNQDDRLAEMHEAMYGKAQGAASGIEIALGKNNVEPEWKRKDWRAAPVDAA